MGSSSKELLHLVHKSSSTTSSNAVLYLRFRVFLPMCTVFLFFLPKYTSLLYVEENRKSHTIKQRSPQLMETTGVWQWTMMVLSSEHDSSRQCFCPTCPESETIDDHVSRVIELS
uniref:Uncharacterized protein n=1 Tax=Populus trichocarpa TaxID=3694 RepID=A0A3N7FJ96_POPTR